MILQENIAAISTPPGVGGVAIVRISGEDPLSVLSKMFRPAGKVPVADFDPYRLYPGVIEAEGFSDFGMAVFFRSPKSYTGENMVEIHCHGGVAIARGVLEKTFSLGCRPASRGEFSKRAFLNGKMSLSSSEGLIDMIHAESRAGAAVGYELYREKLYGAVENLRRELTFALAEIDAEIDYPEEGLEEKSDAEIREKLTSVAERLQKLAATFKTGSRLKNGVRVAIVGRPNTGKSSLLNALIGREKAIVTEIAGTTRDVVEGETELGGVRFLFSDTAGIRESEDKVEKIGVSISKKLAENCDLALFVTDSGDFDEETAALFSSRIKAGEKAWIVLNKSDLSGTKAHEKAVAEKYGEPLVLSCKTGDGVEKLREKLEEFALSGAADPEAGYLTEERHYAIVQETGKLLFSAAAEVGNVPCDLLAADVTEAWQKLGEITGSTAPEEVINEIFDKFCVGK